jgi:hypothetical protein
VLVSLTLVWLVVCGLAEGVCGYTVMLLVTLLLLSLTGRHCLYTATVALLLVPLLLILLIALIAATASGYYNFQNY